MDFGIIYLNFQKGLSKNIMFKNFEMQPTSPKTLKILVSGLRKIAISIKTKLFGTF